MSKLNIKGLLFVAMTPPAIVAMTPPAIKEQIMARGFATYPWQAYAYGIRKQ